MPVLQLVTGPRERRARRDGRGSAPSTRRSRSPPPRSRRPRPSRARPRARSRRLRGERGADRGGEQQRPDQVRAAPLVLLPARLAVLVRPDRDVLGAVVGGEARSPAARASPAGATATPPSSSRAPGRAASTRRSRCAASPAAIIEPSTAGRSNGSRASGQARRMRGSSSERVEQPGRAAEQRIGHAGAAQALLPRGDPELAVVGANRNRPRGRPVDEHAVLQRHAAEANLLVGHVPRLAADGSARRGGGSRPRARGRRPRSARRPSGSAAPPAPGSSCASGRSRTRPSRTPRAASASR